MSALQKKIQPFSMSHCHAMWLDTYTMYTHTVVFQLKSLYFSVDFVKYKILTQEQKTFAIYFDYLITYLINTYLLFPNICISAIGSVRSNHSLT